MLLVYPNPSLESPYRFTPLSILFAGAFFEKQGKTVEYFDERFDSLELFDELVGQSKEIGVSCFTGYQCLRTAELLTRAKAINEKIITGVGGIHVQILPQQVIREKFVDRVWIDKSYGEDLFPYNDKTKKHFMRTDMQYFTSRGCPFNCSFCAMRMKWQPKPIDEIDRELKILHKDIGFKTISFSDPNVAVGDNVFRVNRIRDVGSILRDINVDWYGNIRADSLTPEMVDALVYSKCKYMEIGCESGDDYFLKKVIRKGYGVETIKTAVRNISGSGISVMYSFMANTPQETPEMLNKTLDLIDWIVATDEDARVSIHNYFPYPGTPMYLNAVNGIGYPKFAPPTDLRGWGETNYMLSPLYWISGLCFRQDVSHKNFKGKDWELIKPYIELAQKKWKERDITEFPCNEVEQLIEKQVKKNERRK